MDKNNNKARDTLVKLFKNSNGINFILYIGLNDKDTYKPMKKSKAIDIIKNICPKYVEGYTYYFATGGWHNPKTNKNRYEKVLICILNNTNRKTVNKIVDELLVLFNQQSILIQPSGIFYKYSNRK